jgi:hypothetical protein
MAIGMKNSQLVHISIIIDDFYTFIVIFAMLLVKFLVIYRILISNLVFYG